MAKTANDLVTKKYLDSRFYKFKKEIVLAVDNKGDELKGELYNIKDEVVGEIKGNERRV